MASPQYGERWAQKWLDVVRYADTNGFEADGYRAHAWRYRDYVVAAFNRDKPFDRFVKEQIAGDELFPGDQEALVATGFHRAGPIHLVGGVQDQEMNRQEVLTEMTGALGSAFLGLTIGCARCHNHKFDPIPQADYYRLQATLAATVHKDLPLAGDAEKQAHEAATKAHAARLAPIRKEIDAIEKPHRDRLRDQKRKTVEKKFLDALEIPKDKRDEEQTRLAKEAEAQLKVAWDEVLAVLPPAEKERRAALRRQMHAIDDEAPEPLAAAFAVANMDTAPKTHILKIGNHKMKLGEVEPGLLRVMTSATVTASPNGRRADLANWIASPSHPLTARVMVNRIWQLRMGSGIVATPNDFGVLGSRPSNQKLLDWLATEFIRGGWSVKNIDRLIVTSNVYRQSAAWNEAGRKADPENKLYWRANRRRLEAEFLRDAVLAAAGTLNPRMGGRPVRVPIEPEIYDLIFTEGEPDHLWPLTPDRREHLRRSLYLLNKRTIRLPMLANFDQPDAMTSCPVRQSSTHALQALSLLNSDLMRHQSEAFARSVEAECGAGLDCRIRRIYKRALARAPEPAEMSTARDFLTRGGPLEDFCLAMLNRNEFAYVP
jgi:hypothetical protein